MEPVRIPGSILAGEVRRFGYTWQAVGAYHADPAQSVAREQRRMRYAQRVYHNLVNDNHHVSDGVRVYARTKQ